MGREGAPSLTGDYAARVYAGLIGKTLGVYLGRPVEGWSFERIRDEIGEIDGFLHERAGVPLVLVDDDISGTLAFLRALPDHGLGARLTSREIGRTWRDVLIEGRTVLWWGGNGESTEHTAYLNLARGIEAPESGAEHRNGRIVAEQIGAQIFIDGWAMAAPGDPTLAARLAGEAARVSHDGAAVDAARLLAAMEAQAFVEPDMDAVLDVGLGFVPEGSVIAELARDVRRWCAGDDDWRRTRERVEERYGYHRYGGNCHVVPNHAVVLLAALHGRDDLRSAIRIATACGWDTDCNAGNVGCLVGILRGTEGLASVADLRAAVADRLYVSTADGGRCVTDAAREAQRIVGYAHLLQGLTPPTEVGTEPRFRFPFAGSVQGWRARPVAGTVAIGVENVRSSGGGRCLALRYRDSGRVATPVFVPPEVEAMPPGYGLEASPTLCPGQRVRARLTVAAEDAHSVRITPYVSVYGPGDVPARRYGPATDLPPGGEEGIDWTIPDLGGHPAFELGLELSAEAGTSGASGTVLLHHLTWSGAPRCVFRRPDGGGRMWRRSWVQGVDHVSSHDGVAFRLSQDRGRGLLAHGAEGWRDYRVAADLTARAAGMMGICARFQGMERYYALVLRADGSAALIRRRYEDQVLAVASFAWMWERAYVFALTVDEGRIRGSIDGRELFDVHDDDRPYRDGGVALLAEEGLVMTDRVQVGPRLG